MSEIDYLKCKLEDSEKAFDKLHKRHIELLKQQGALEQENEMLKKENRELNSIKKFAEKNGINIFLIEEAFRRCWKDNGKLFEENNKLRQILKDIVCATDETYSKNTSMFKVTVVLDNEKYREIRRCIE